jgi:hypothetical protein
LFYELGRGRLNKASRVWLIAITVFSLLTSFASGFLIGGTLQSAVAFAAFSLGRNKLPLVTMLVLAAVLAFLHAGKGDMRKEFWDEQRNYGSIQRSSLDIYQYWLAASWGRVTGASSPDEQVPSIIERASLLKFLSLVVRETPEQQPYMYGLTYQQTISIFIPRFLWPDKPRASTPDETLAIYYGIQTQESADVTAIGLGRISEAWANFGWFGIGIIGTIMGLILRVPRRLSTGFTPTHLGFLLSVQFISFAMNLEAGFGPAIHALSQTLVISFASLWVVSKTPAHHRATPFVEMMQPAASSAAPHRASSAIQ